MIAKLFLILLTALPLAVQAHDDAAETLPEEVVAAPLFSSCFQPDAKFGRLPKAECTTRLRPKWADQAQVFKFNQLGLRDRDYSPDPGPKTVRILLLGPMFDGFNLSDDEAASFRLQERLQATGIGHAEVINGAVSGFFAPRAAEFALKLIDAYHPDMVIYFQMTDALNNDLVEERSIRGSDANVESFQLATEFSAAPAGLSWVWPDRETQRLISSSFHQLAALWSVHHSSQSIEDEVRTYVQPSIRALKKIQAHLSADQRLVVFMGMPKTHGGYDGSELSGTWASLFAHMTPKTYIPPDLVSLYFRSEGFHVYPVARGFKTPVQNNLTFERRPLSLTAQGAHVFAWSSSFWIRPELMAMKKGSDIKALVPRKKRFKPQ